MRFILICLIIFTTALAILTGSLVKRLDRKITAIRDDYNEQMAFTQDLTTYLYDVVMNLAEEK